MVCSAKQNGASVACLAVCALASACSVEPSFGEPTSTTGATVTSVDASSTTSASAGDGGAGPGATVTATATSVGGSGGTHAGHGHDPLRRLAGRRELNNVQPRRAGESGGLCAEPGSEELLRRLQAGQRVTSCDRKQRSS